MQSKGDCNPKGGLGLSGQYQTVATVQMGNAPYMRVYRGYMQDATEMK